MCIGRIRTFRESRAGIQAAARPCASNTGPTAAGWCRSRTATILQEYAGPLGELAAVVAALGAAVSDYDTRLAALGPGSA